jgi:hypothetical protein
MRRLAPAVAAAALALLARGARAEPLDVNLVRLGAPDPAVWLELDAEQGAAMTPAEAATFARDAKERFAVLSTEVAMAMSSALLQPASTTGHSGYDIALEASYGTVHDDAIGQAPPLGFTDQPWATRSTSPSALLASGVHVRKALPFSFEMGGRLTYLTQTSYLAAQGELKWALNEGLEYVPDIAVRAAYTRLFGQREWNLDVTDLDFMVSRRWGVSGVTSFTPYVAARLAIVSASTDMLDFGPYRSGAPGPGPNDAYRTVAAFPELRMNLYRTTIGVRMTAHVVSLALEATYFSGKKYSGKATPTREEYGDFTLDSTFSGAFKLGWEF